MLGRIEAATRRRGLSGTGLFSGLFMVRSVRGAAHAGRAVKRAVTPKSIKRARRAMHPVSNAAYSLERSLSTKPRPASSGAVYRHESCPGAPPPGRRSAAVPEPVSVFILPGSTAVLLVILLCALFALGLALIGWWAVDRSENQQDELPPAPDGGCRL